MLFYFFIVLLKRRSYPGRLKLKPFLPFFLYIIQTFIGQQYCLKNWEKTTFWMGESRIRRNTFFSALQHWLGSPYYRLPLSKKCSNFLKTLTWPLSGSCYLFFSNHGTLNEKNFILLKTWLDQNLTSVLFSGTLFGLFASIFLKAKIPILYIIVFRFFCSTELAILLIFESIFVQYNRRFVRKKSAKPFFFWIYW